MVHGLGFGHARVLGISRLHRRCGEQAKARLASNRPYYACSMLRQSVRADGDRGSGSLVSVRESGVDFVRARRRRPSADDGVSINVPLHLLAEVTTQRGAQSDARRTCGIDEQPRAVPGTDDAQISVLLIERGNASAREANTPLPAGKTRGQNDAAIGLVERAGLARCRARDEPLGACVRTAGSRACAAQRADTRDDEGSGDRRCGGRCCFQIDAWIGISIEDRISIDV